MEIYGDGKLKDGVSGAMFWYVNENGKKTILTVEEMALIKTMHICEGVTEIGDFSLCAFENLESIVLPDSLIRIGTSALMACRKIKSVTVPQNVEKIGMYAFPSSPDSDSDDPGSLEVIYVEGRSSAPSGWTIGWNNGVRVEWNA